MEVPGYNGVSNGTCNFWGSASGPSGFGPGPASASSVSGNVTFLPWWAAAGGPCTGGLVFCPSSTKVNVRWHYSANGSSGSWSGTKSTNCQDGSVAIGPQAMGGRSQTCARNDSEGRLRLRSLGQQVFVHGPQVSGAKVVFQARCVPVCPGRKTPLPSRWPTARIRSPTRVGTDPAIRTTPSSIRGRSRFPTSGPVARCDSTREELSQRT